MRTKHELRIEFLKRRKAMDSLECNRKSHLILQQIILSDIFSKSISLFTYLSFGNEVQTDGLVKEALIRGKYVFAPRIFEDSLYAHQVRKVEIDIEIGPYGIRQPGDTTPQWEGNSFDVVFIPGIVFDRRGHRIGFGKGYFDRFLNAINYTTLIALGYEWQVVDTVPIDRDDVAFQYIVTERGFLKC